jgi:hypothetical protein
MSKASRGDPVLAEMDEGPAGDAVFKGHTDEEVREQLPEGLEALRSAYQEFWAETHPLTAAIDSRHENSAPIVEQDPAPLNESQEMRENRAPEFNLAFLKPRPPRTKDRINARPTRRTKVRIPRQRGIKTISRSGGRPAKQRFGLPEGFVPRLQRFGRGVLMEMNIYRLPNGLEFLPCLPTGPLGGRHLYGLLTAEQHLCGSRGSVYVRADGKIFDYSVVSENPLGDMFDTGYTIYDLERTGRYAPGKESKMAQAASRVKRPAKQKLQRKKSRRAAAAG